MEQPPAEPLDYTIPQRRRAVWPRLLIVGTVAAGVSLVALVRRSVLPVVVNRAVVTVSIGPSLTRTLSNRVPIYVREGLRSNDVEVSTRFRIISGDIERTAGLIVRYQDKDNYYVVRADALKHNVRLYKVIEGKPTQLAGADAKVSSNEWHQLTLGVSAHHFKVSFEGTPLLEADDGTIGSAGKIGLCTKADSVTEFDALSEQLFGENTAGPSTAN